MKIVIFDFDGVIVDSFTFCHRISNSISEVTQDEYRSRFEGNINDATQKACAHLPPSEINFSAEYDKEIVKCVPHAEIVEAIKELLKNYQLAIISSTDSWSIDEFLKSHGIRECFSDILGNDVDKSKVKKINMLFAKYSVLPADMIFITDTLGDIKEAKHCNVASIGVTWGFHKKERLQKEKPYKIIDDKKHLMDAVNGYFKVGESLV
ncbi:MAG: HAD family hydrolase [Candidatus Taylorbacteria bacterium]|nr:HAD family hydrolase [Candidatus Taylorbacteria bacterium]